ncbi:hypothetical protein PA6566_01055 [Pseudomonas aeruginosa]|nr:ATPase AAA [Enterobacter cloacae]
MNEHLQPSHSRHKAIRDGEITAEQATLLILQNTAMPGCANACLEDLDYRSLHGLAKALILQLSSGQWLRDGLNLIIGGPTGVGKTWLACALAHKACRDGYSVRYLRLPRLLEELGLAHGDGRFAKLMSSYAKTDLLILDDWGLAPFTGEQRRDMLELLTGLLIRSMDAMKAVTQRGKSRKEKYAQRLSSRRQPPVAFNGRK